MQWLNYKDTLLTGFQMLAENPEVGRRCENIYPKGFYFPVGKHTAYFTKEDGFILVVAVLSQSQLPQNHLWLILHPILEFRAKILIGKLTLS